MSTVPKRLPLRVGGVLRCCILTLDTIGPPASMTKEGDTLECSYCTHSLIVRDGAWQWNRTRRAHFDGRDEEPAGRAAGGIGHVVIRRHADGRVTLDKADPTVAFAVELLTGPAPVRRDGERIIVACDNALAVYRVVETNEADATVVGVLVERVDHDAQRLAEARALLDAWCAAAEDGEALGPLREQTLGWLG